MSAGSKKTRLDRAAFAALEYFEARHERVYGHTPPRIYEKDFLALVDLVFCHADGNTGRAAKLIDEMFDAGLTESWADFSTCWMLRACWIEIGRPTRIGRAWPNSKRIEILTREIEARATQQLKRSRRAT